MKEEEEEEEIENEQLKDYILLFIYKF